MDFPRGDLMFRPVMTKAGKPVEFQFEDEIITAIDGDNVAAALLKAGRTDVDKKLGTGFIYLMLRSTTNGVFPAAHIQGANFP